MKSVLSSLCLLLVVSCKPPESCPTIDCNDPTCSAAPACQPEDCANTIDDNGDGAIDCNDAQCSGSTLCPSCGDGAPNPGEQCDDGNQQNGDGCEIDCTISAGVNCGDGVLNPGEQCDDGNNASGDSCLANCILPLTSCGDGVVNPGEQCDDGNQIDGDACESDCSNPGCGNGIVDDGEECDDTNTTPGDGCDAACQVEAAAFCGDGVINANEACDEGALNSDTTPDACRLDCSLPSCGDAVLDGAEECDDGDNTAGDGCAASCTIEPPFDVDCPQFTGLNKFCVPLPNSGNQLTEVGPAGVCGAGFFKENPTSGADNSESFSVRKLFDDVILIKETNNFTGERPVMVLFLGADRALLFDSGHVTGAVANVIAPFVEGRPVEVLNTHLHGDHINNNPDFDVIAIDTAVDNIRTFCGITAASFDANQSAICNNAGNYLPPGGQTLNAGISFQVVRVVRDGHVIELGGHQITVLFTPGHSKTSVTLHDTTRALLFTGDTLYPDTDIISGADVGIPLVHPSGSNLAEYFTTAQRYAALEGQVLAVVGAHSQGTMPARSLSAFLQIVQDRINGGGNNVQFNDPQGCGAGNFSVQGFPP